MWRGDNRQQAVGGRTVLFRQFEEILVARDQLTSIHSARIRLTAIRTGIPETHKLGPTKLIDIIAKVSEKTGWV